MSIFKGINVLDMTLGPVGGLASMVMADFGAAVIKVEPPKGDPFRSMPSSESWMRGKKSRVINLKSKNGQSQLKELILNTDIILTNSRPRKAKLLNLDDKSIRKFNKNIIHCSITGFERKGNLANIPGYEGLIAAKSGYMMTFEGIGKDQATNKYREGPVYSAVLLATHAASQIALQSITAALIYREKSGIGQYIETSLLRGMIPIDTAGLFIAQIRERLKDKLPKAIDPEFGMLPALGYHPIPTKDGKWIQLAGLVSHLFHAFIDVAGLNKIYENPQFLEPREMSNKDKDQLAKIIAKKTMGGNADQWMNLFVKNGNVAAEKWNSTNEAMSHPQVLYNKDVWEYTSKELGLIKQLGPLAHFSKNKADHPGAKPKINQHSDYAWPKRKNKKYNPTNKKIKKGPLDGLIFLEFASIIAAPYACTILGELGARVIKIEPIEGDNFRVGANPGTGKQIKGLGAIKTTSNKESICIDLKSKEGIKIAHELIKKADGMLHNYRPGVTDKLEIDYKTVKKINSKIVYVSAWGYGKSGPYAHRPTAAPGVGAAMGGALKQFGGTLPKTYKNNLSKSIEAAIKIYTANPGSSDYNAAHIIASAAIMGLYAQRKNGTGQEIDCNMLSANAYANFDYFIDYKTIEHKNKIDKEITGLSALYRLYKTKKGWVFFACQNKNDWANFIDYINHKKFDKKSNFNLPENIIGLKTKHSQILEKIFLLQSAAKWEKELSKKSIGCVEASQYLPGTFWHQDKHVAENYLTIEVPNPIWKKIRRHATLAKFSSFLHREGVQITAGQNTKKILTELGYKKNIINVLHKNKIIATHKNK